MGLPFSAFNKFGLPGLSSATTGQVYDRHFKDKETESFAKFHIAYVEFCKYFNTVLPGQDFDTPSLEELRRFYDGEWEPLRDPEEKRQAFIKYMEKHVTEAKVDDKLFIAAGLVAPAAAIIAKRTGENIPQVKKLKLNYVPNVVFVPLVTLLAIMGATAVQMNKKSKTEESKTKEESKIEESKTKDTKTKDSKTKDTKTKESKT